MNILKKSILSVFLLVALLLSVGGCSESSGKKEQPQDSETVGFKPSPYNEDNLFKNGLTPFRYSSDDKMGYIDQTGTFIIEPKFDTATDFAANGLAAVEVNDKWGYIDVNGSFVIEPTYGSAHAFDSDNLAIVFLNGFHGIIDANGNWVVPNQYSTISKFSEEGLALICKKFDNGERFAYGYIDRSGNEVIPAIYEEAEEFKNGYAIFMTKDYQYGAIDTKGNVVLEPIYQQLSDFGPNGLAYAELTEKVGYVEAGGTFRFELDSSIVSGYPFAENGIAFVYNSGRASLINEKGEILTDSFNSVAEFDETGLLAARTQSTVGYINTQGQFVISGSYDLSMPFANGFAKIKKDGLLGYIDTTGKIIIAPQYERATDFGADGFAIVSIETDDDKMLYALIDSTGKYIINFQTA